MYRYFYDDQGNIHSSTKFNAKRTMLAPPAMEGLNYIDRPDYYVIDDYIVDIDTLEIRQRQ